MHTGNSLPIRATFIALCATLGLALLCGCAKQGLTLLTVPPAAEEVSALVKEAIAEAGATTKQHMGAVMKIVSAKAAGRADGRTLSTEVQKQLG